MLHAMLKGTVRYFQESLAGNRGVELPYPADRFFALDHETFDHLEAERLRDKRVVAELRLAVERQVVAVQRDAVLHQAAHTFPELPHEDAVLVNPETVRMVDKDTVRTILNGGIDQAVTERYPRHDAGHLVGSLHAEAIVAVILEQMRLQQVVETGRKIGNIHKPYRQ